MTFAPVDCGVLRPKPCDTKDDRVVAEFSDVEFELLLLVAEFVLEDAGMCDVARGDWSSIDDEERDGLRFLDEGEVVGLAEVLIDEV